MDFIKEAGIFLSEFARHRKEVGSIANSSRFLAKKMISDPAFREARRIVELGPGLGSITKQIVRQMHPDATLKVFETNKNFCEKLREKFADPRVTILNVSACSLSERLPYKADYIVSGIPLAVLGREEHLFLLREIEKTLDREGVFVQFQYSLASYRRLKQFFPSIEILFVPLNIPPAFVYVCRKSDN